jgi:hypothetical protein
MAQLTEKSGTFLWYWLWALPSIGLGCVAWTLFDPSAFQECPQALFTFPLIGTTTAGWTWIRTFDRRFLPQLCCSAVLLVAGVWMFWTMM